MNMPIVILAGGRATRMGGQDKPLLLLRGQTLLSIILDRLQGQGSPVALNANGDPARFAQYGLPVLPDSLPEYPGPLAGILVAMEWAASQGAAQVVTVAGDTPLFPRDLVAGLTRAAVPAGLALAATRDGGVLRDHPTFGMWPVDLRDDLRATLAQGQGRVRSFTARHGAVQAVWDAMPHDPFANINTPDDLTRTEAQLAAL
ncbi:molybdenum cofactor guanylyltransferase MobA [Paracoccus sp. R86501]|uniref:molybdenum cofactor guanylyltransferase MobA n=1 Tax=Paracoccus sp. R86501 TaxID=3101711 RepID=UPI0036734809